MSISQTTLNIAIPSVNPSVQAGPIQGTLVTPASMTGILAPGPNKSNRTILWIDREAFEVVAITANNATCHRGVYGTLMVGHVAGTPIWVGHEADFTYFNENETNGGLGLYSRMCVPFSACYPVQLTATATMTAAALLGGLIQGTPTAAANYTTPTASQIIGALQAFSNPFLGQSFEFTILNTSAGANTITVLAGTGVTLTGGTVTIAQNAARKFKVVVTSLSTPTVTIFQVS